MIIAKEYVVEFDSNNNLYTIKNCWAPLCPVCGELLSGYDHRKRIVLGNDGKPYVFLLRRLKCRKCEKLHLELPDLATPNVHYSSETIRQALSPRGGSCPADNATIRRWKRKK